jgi:hypothetical protein
MRAALGSWSKTLQFCVMILVADLMFLSVLIILFILR